MIFLRIYMSSTRYCVDVVQCATMHANIFRESFLSDEQWLRMEDKIARVCVFEFKTLLSQKEEFCPT